MFIKLFLDDFNVFNNLDTQVQMGYHELDSPFLDDCLLLVYFRMFLKSFE